MLLIEKLKALTEENPTRFFMPGHKGKLHPYDITELDLLDGTATNLLLAAAEKNTAKLYGAKYTNFLYSSTTAGILGLISSLKRRMIIGRASHKSLFNGCVLFGIEPIIIDNEYSEGIALPLSPEQIERALSANPDADAVFVTTPNYFGQNADLQAIKKICQENDVWLFVDGAHGAHFGTYKRLPDNATKYADACVLSAHKTLPSLTQTAYLNINDPEIQRRCDKYFYLTRTTSPSYLFAAALEYAADYAFKNTARYDALYAAIKKHLPYRMKNDDFMRIVWDMKKIGVSGIAADKFLKQNGVYAELYCERYLVFIVTVMDEAEDVIKLDEAYKKLLKAAKALPKYRDADLYQLKIARAVSFTEASRSETELVDLEDSEGRISAMEIGVLPPCLPMVARGEIITAEVIEQMRGKNCFGLEGDKAVVLK